MIAHVAAAIGVALVLSGGLLGLGELLGGRNSGDRWVRGWTAVWWPVALAAQFISPRAGFVCGACIAAAGLVQLIRRRRELQRAALAGAIAVLAGAPLWLAPPHFFDALVYHLGLPWSWLTNGDFAPVAHNLFSRFPLAGSTVFLIPVGLGLPEAAAGLHWATFVAALAALVSLARNLGAGRWSPSAAVMLAASWHAPWLASIAGADHLVLLGVLVAFDAWTDPTLDERRSWLTAGLALGLALASKFTAAIPAAAALVAALAVGRRLGSVAAAGAAAAAAASFWWVRNLVQTGNPVFPLLWNWFGGSGWTAADYARYTGIVREGVDGPLGALLAPIRLAVPAALGVWFGVAAIVGVAALVTAHGDARRVRSVAAGAVLTLGGWAVTAQTPRYALPAAALVAALAASGLARMSRSAARIGAAVLALASLYGFAVFGGFMFQTLQVQRTWSAASEREAWRHAVTMNDPAPAYVAMENLLDPDARVLLVGEGRPWQCPVRHHASSPYDKQLLQSVVEESPTAEAVRERLYAAGYTHLLFNWAEVERLRAPPYQVLRWSRPDDRERFGEFGRRYTARIWREGRLEIRALVQPTVAVERAPHEASRPSSTGGTRDGQVPSLREERDSRVDEERRAR